MLRPDKLLELRIALSNSTKYMLKSLTADPRDETMSKYPAKKKKTKKPQKVKIEVEEIGDGNL